MTLAESVGKLSLPEAPKAVLILDASESAERQQEAILQLARGVLDLLPAQVDPVLYFLGNPSPYQPAQLSTNAGIWFLENRKRASLVTPIFEQIAEPERVRIAIVGAGKVFDLEDWENTLHLQRTLLVRLGDSLQPRPVAKELASPAPTELVHWLHDPVQHVALSGPGFMPLGWSNDSYQLVRCGAAFALVGENLSQWPVAIRFLADPPQDVRAQLQHASGTTDTLPLQPANSNDLPEPPIGRLDAREQEAFDCAIHQQPFRCPSCGGECAWDLLRCRARGGFGHLVYPSIERARLNGFVRMWRGDGDVCFRAAGRGVLLIGPDQVIVKTHGARPLIYQYSPSAKQWQETSEYFTQYLRVGPDAYAILV